MPDWSSFSHQIRTLSFSVAALSLAAASLGATGCGLFDGSDSTSLLKVHGMHSGTPDGTTIPNNGFEGTPRVFEREDGWEITLFEAYITTTDVEFVKCDGSSATLVDMWWGPCAEDFIRDGDGAPLPVGGVNMADGDYCTMRIRYGNYEPLPPDDPAHDPPANEIVENNTIVLRGRAQLGDNEPIEFEATSSEVFVVSLDISNMQSGGPLELDAEDFPVQVTVAKLYDKWFEGMDFEDFSEEELVDRVKASLANDTIPVFGAGFQ